MIQIDMQMPKNCNECNLSNSCGSCLVNDKHALYDAEERPEWCPLTELLEVVHCGECVHKHRLGDLFGKKAFGVEWSQEVLDKIYCEPMRRLVDKNDYCGFAERKK